MPAYQQWQMSSRFCRCILPLAGSILWPRTDIGQAEPPGLLPEKRTRLRSPVSSSPANMAVNSPEPRNLPTITGWSWGCGLVLNLPKDVFSTRIRPSYGSVPCRALARSWWQTFYMVTGGLPIPPPQLTPRLGTLPIGVCKSFFSQPPNDGGARATSRPWLIVPPCMCVCIHICMCMNVCLNIFAYL